MIARIFSGESELAAVGCEDIKAVENLVGEILNRREQFMLIRSTPYTHYIRTASVTHIQVDEHDSTATSHP